MPSTVHNCELSLLNECTSCKVSQEPQEQEQITNSYVDRHVRGKKGKLTNTMQTELAQILVLPATTTYIYTVTKFTSYILSATKYTYTLLYRTYTEVVHVPVQTVCMQSKILPNLLGTTGLGVWGSTRYFA